MRRRIAFAVLLSLSAMACSGAALPTQPTSLPSGLASMSGSASGAPTTAQSLGNSNAALQCQKGGYRDLVRTDGTGFRSVGECVSYVAHGGTFGGGSGGGNESGKIVYTLRVSGTEIGDFGWSFATPAFITTTTTVNSFLSTSSSSGCAISSVTINNPSGAGPFVETFFSPSCPGGGFFWTEFAQTFWNAGPFDHIGVYVPQGVTSPLWTLTIAQQ